MAEYLLVNESGEGIWQRVLLEGELRQEEYYQEVIQMYEEEKDIERDILRFILSNTHAEEDQDIVMMECDQYEEEEEEEKEEEWDQEVSPEEEEDQEAILYNIRNSTTYPNTLSQTPIR